MNKRLLILAACAAMFIVACQQSEPTPSFVRVEDGHFVRDGKPY